MNFQSRYWEIDSLRGIAIIGMVIYHICFDLSIMSPILTIIAKLTAITFIFLVGFSYSISATKHQNNYLSLTKHTFLKSGKLLFCASLVTLATFLINPDFTVRFGILHLISFSLILLLPLILIQDRKYLLFIALFIFLISKLMKPIPYNTFDYFPIIPWFGIVILGYIFSPIYLSMRSKKIDNYSHPVFRSIALLGRHSLLIYLVHQPIILGTLILLKVQ